MIRLASQKDIPGRDDKPNRIGSRRKVVHLLVKMYKHRGRKSMISFGIPFPERPRRLRRPPPIYKNMVQEAVKVQKFLTEDPSRTYRSASQEFNLTRARISQLMKIANNLPKDFIEKMKACEESRVLKMFSGKQLLRITALKTEGERQDEIKRLSHSL